MQTARVLLSAVLGLLIGFTVSVQGQQRTVISHGTSLPVTCAVGDLFFLTVAPIGLHACTATNTWKVLSPAVGSTGAVQVKGSDGILSDVPSLLWNGTYLRFRAPGTSNSFVINNSGTFSTYAYIDTPATIGTSAAVSTELDVAADGDSSKIGLWTEFVVDDEGDYTYNYIEGNRNTVTSYSTGTFDYIYARADSVIVNAGTVTNGITGINVQASSGATAPYLYGLHLYMDTYGDGVIPYAAGIWIEDMSAATTKPYYEWFDSRGVYRIREDNVADGSGNPQAIPALYNPRFAKYTPGAVDYERGVEQWVGNVLQMGVEAGGAGTRRSLELIGGGLVLDSNLVTPASSGTRFLCISTAGVITSSSSACSGT